jgi:hypothetical protein
MSRNRSFSLMIAVFAAGLAGCAQQQPAPPPDTRAVDEATIRTADADWAKAALAKDLDTCMSYYADDKLPGRHTIYLQLQQIIKLLISP